MSTRWPGASPRGLQARGIEAGDAVAFQLPNWLEAAATFYAVAYLGAVVVPIVHFYGPKEVGYILRKTNVKALVTADRFGHQDFLAEPRRARAGISRGSNGSPSSAIARKRHLAPATLRSRTWSRASRSPRSRQSIPVRPRSSRTRRAPRRTRRVSCTRTGRSPPRSNSSRAMQANRDGPAMITGAPVGHGIGMLAALLVPVYNRTEIHLIDVWDPGRVLAAMLDDGLSAGQGSTFFLTSLLDHPDYKPELHAPLMPFVGLGGAAVPAAVGERCAAIGIEIARSFGSTEHPSITGSTPAAPHESASPRTGGRCPASRYVWSTTTATTSKSDCRVRSGAVGQTSSSDTRTRSRPRRHSAPTGGS